MPAQRDFNPRPPRGGRHWRRDEETNRREISIHAPREGGDFDLTSRLRIIATFQSTPPARGATFIFSASLLILINFNPRPPRGGRQWAIPFNGVVSEFQSTPPARGATSPILRRAAVQTISIHAPREGGDRDFVKWNCTVSNFNPRPPRGGRRRNQLQFAEHREFQSTPPARGATAHRGAGDGPTAISIHAPREGGDVAGHGATLAVEISIHAPREGGDDARLTQIPRRVISIHAPREGGDNCVWRAPWQIWYFNPRPPRGGRLPVVGFE